MRGLNEVKPYVLPDICASCGAQTDSLILRLCLSQNY